jgi:hypothetical protein
MKNSKEHAQGKPPAASIPRSIADQAEHHDLEAEHWETLLSLLAQSPAATLPVAAPPARGRSGEVPNTIASTPLLKPEPISGVIKIARSTVENFPLPSIVPSAQSTERTTEPVAKQQAAKPAAKQAAPAVMRESAAAPTEASAEPRKQAMPERLTESWAERLAQRVRETFDKDRASRASNIKPVNKAEVAYNPQGTVDYVTYTINAPMRKNRGQREPLT